MKKLALKVEELRVEKFEVQPAAEAERGTVHGRQLSNANTEPCRFCPEMPITYSCEYTGVCC